MENINTRVIGVSAICLAFVAAGCGSSSDSGVTDNDPAMSGQESPQVVLQSEGRFNVCRSDQDFLDSVLPMDNAWYEGSGGVCVRLCDPVNSIVAESQEGKWAFDETAGQQCLNLAAEDTQFGAQVPIYDTQPLIPIDDYRVIGQRLYARGDKWVCSRQTRQNYQQAFSAVGDPLLYEFSPNGELSSSTYNPEQSASEQALQSLGYWVDSFSFDETLGILNSLDNNGPDAVVGPVYPGYTAYFYSANEVSDLLTIFKTSDDKMACELVHDTALNMPAISRLDFEELTIADVLNVPMTCNVYEQTYYSEVLHSGTRLSSLVDYPGPGFSATLTEVGDITLEDSRNGAQFVARSFEFANEQRMVSLTDNLQYNFVDRYAGLNMLASPTQTIARFRNGLSFFPGDNDGDTLRALPNSHSAFHRLPGGEVVFEEILADGGSTQFWEQYMLCQPDE
ncbi:MAG: hypothetical protein AAF404_11740 [Pseudomonadota bacterium]